MEFAPGLMLIVQGLSVTMTAPTFDNFRTVLASWILSGDRTARPTIRAAGRLADQHDVTGVECSPHALAFARQKLGDRVICGRLPDEVDLPAKSYDVVLLTDALEHIEDDVASVQTAMRLLKPAGIVVATEPAYQWLYSPRDRHHHQFRCYGKRQFAALWQHDDAETVLLSHYNTLLFPPAAVARFASKVLGSGKDAGDLAVPPRFLNSVLAAVMGSETHLLGRVPLPFGLSLVGVVRKTEINQNFVTAAA